MTDKDKQTIRSIVREELERAQLKAREAAEAEERRLYGDLRICGNCHERHVLKPSGRCLMCDPDKDTYYLCGRTHPPTGTCKECGLRPATGWFAADMTSAARGKAEAWCERCMLYEQIKTCRAAAARLPELEAKLAALDAPEILYTDEDFKVLPMGVLYCRECLPEKHWTCQKHRAEFRAHVLIMRSK